MERTDKTRVRLPDWEFFWGCRGHNHPRDRPVSCEKASVMLTRLFLCTTVGISHKIKKSYCLRRMQVRGDIYEAVAHPFERDASRR